MSRTLAERHSAKYVVDESGCWLWTGALNNMGYGVINLGREVGTALAHRVSYQLHVGEIPDESKLDHLCRIRHCVNPDHLEPVTRKENILRGTAPSADNARKTECPNGHPYDSMYIRPRKPFRNCTQCQFKESNPNVIKDLP